MSNEEEEPQPAQVEAKPAEIGERPGYKYNKNHARGDGGAEGSIQPV